MSKSYRNLPNSLKLRGKRVTKRRLVKKLWKKKMAECIDWVVSSFKRSIDKAIYDSIVQGEFIL